MAEEKRARKLSKEIVGTVVTITEKESGITKNYDFATLPAEIQTKLGPLGLNHRLGDSAAGKSGQEAVDAIDKVWEGLLAGNWTVRVPAGPKIKKEDVLATFNKLSAKEQAIARPLLESLGLLPKAA